MKIGDIRGIGPLGLPLLGTEQSEAFTQFTSVLTIIVSITTICAGIWFMLQVFISAFKWLVSAGDKQAVETARKGLTNAVIGLFLVVFAYGFTAIIGLVLGFNILSPIDVLQTSIP